MQRVSEEIRRSLMNGKLQEEHFQSRCFQQWMQTYDFKSADRNILNKMAMRFEGDFAVFSTAPPGFSDVKFRVVSNHTPRSNDGQFRIHEHDALYIIGTFQQSFNTFEFVDVLVCANQELWRDATVEEKIAIQAHDPRYFSSRTQIALSLAIGIPIICFHEICRSHRGITGRIPGKYALLVLVYETIIDLHPYDVEQQIKLVALINKVYDRSIASFDHAHLKIDYELVVLHNYQELQRIQETSTVHSKSLYWFDNSHTKTVDAKGVMDLLAIERSWAKDPTSNVRYLVTCGFPAGTMFLKTTVEAQATTRGGGIEYLHLDTGLGYTFINSVQINIDK